jgi:hypothetical protein
MNENPVAIGAINFGLRTATFDLGSRQLTSNSNPFRYVSRQIYVSTQQTKYIMLLLMFTGLKSKAKALIAAYAHYVVNLYNKKTPNKEFFFTEVFTAHKRGF